jgi:hypothetical protein
MQNPVLKSLSLRQMAAAASTVIESIKINSITREMRRGQPMWVKRRRAGSELIAGAANLFFWLGQSPIRVWINTEKWQRWELGCFHLLHDHTLQAFAEGSRTVCEDEVPGEGLLEHVNRGTLKPYMLKAAAGELRRVHEFWCEELGDHWSHGDPHLDNVIYDRAAHRARLIDFEVIHDKSIPAVVRHADDLLVFLQDLMGRVTAGQWLPFAVCFIDAYDRPEVVTELRKRLFVPGGVGGLWWKLRTHYLERNELVRRVDALREALGPRLNATGRFSRNQLGAVPGSS